MKREIHHRTQIMKLPQRKHYPEKKKPPQRRIKVQKKTIKIQQKIEKRIMVKKEALHQSLKKRMKIPHLLYWKHLK